MSWLRRAAYDRRRVLEEAVRDEARGRRRRAIRGYRRVLAAEPGNADVHRRLAPLLARDGQPFDAWLSFGAVARAERRQKKWIEARNVWRDAVDALPERVDGWLALAQAEQRLGRPDAAFDALRAGRARMSRRRRPEAIFLLRKALELRPWEPALVLDLAHLLARAGQRPEAEALLEQLAARTPGPARRRVRGAHWRIAPSLGLAWRWLRAA